MRILYLCLLLLLPAISQAVTCTTNSVALDVNIPPGINFPANLPVNSIIGEYTGTKTTAVACSATGNVTNDKIIISAMGSRGGKIIGDTWVFDSDLPGIGYAFGGQVDGCGTLTWVPNGQWTVIACEKSSAIGNVVSFTPSVRLYKIGTVGLSNSYPMQLVGHVTRQVNGTTYSGPFYQTTPTKIVIAACTVSSKTINVDMGSVEKRLFGGIGTTAGNTKDVNISLNCTRTANVTLSVTGDVSDASKGLLNLTKSQTTAKGIAIQMLLNNQAFKLNSYNSVGNSTSGTYTIPLKARYYQTGDISPGTANSTATFNVVYQ